jgi:hypothetical protein
MWCMRSPSVVVLSIYSIVRFTGVPYITLCGVLSCYFPAIVATLLIMLRGLYTFMILP